MKLFLGILLLGSWAQASVFNCRISENLQVVEKMQVTATDNARVKVSSADAYVFYLSTLSSGVVELEAFLPSVEMRIYSKGNIEKNSVTLTSWQRDGLLEFNCSLETK